MARGPVSEGAHAQFQVFLNNASSKWQRVCCERVADLEGVGERLKALGVGVQRRDAANDRRRLRLLIVGLGKLISLFSTCHQIDPSLQRVLWLRVLDHLALQCGATTRPPRLRPTFRRDWGYFVEHSAHTTKRRNVLRQLHRLPAVLLSVSLRIISASRLWRRLPRARV